VGWAYPHLQLLFETAAAVWKVFRGFPADTIELAYPIEEYALFHRAIVPGLYTVRDAAVDMS